MHFCRFLLFIFTFVIPHALHAVSSPEDLSGPLPPGELKPWFTGSLLSGAGRTVAPGHVNFEPYLSATSFTGGYNQHWRAISKPGSFSLASFASTTIGLMRNVDFVLEPELDINFKNHHVEARVADLPLFMGFQCMYDRRDSWIPDLRMLIKTIFPMGHYQHLNPHLEGADATGTGSYQVGIGSNFQKLFYLGIKLLRMRLNFTYFFPSSVHVRGFNAYGGGYGTSGRVHPGNVFTTTMAFEYTFTQHWIGALDIHYIFQGRTRFSGQPGISLEGTPATVASSEHQQISLAPAIEYAFNRHIGLIIGPWFTIIGKNSPRFISGIIALNYYY